MYLNGQLDDGTLVGTVTATQQNSSANVNIGRRPTGSNFNFNGRIDDVRIYNRALTQTEIQTDMNTPVAGGAGDLTAADRCDHLAREQRAGERHRERHRKRE